MHEYVSVCLCIHVLVWVLAGEGECLDVYEIFFVIKISDRGGGRGGGFGGFRTTPDRRGRGGLKIMILAGRPL